MASIVNDPNGRRRILFVAPDESRKTIRLGKCDRKTAESICRHVEALLAAKIGGQPVPRDTAAWLAGVGEKLRDRLAAVGRSKPQQEREAVAIAAHGMRTGPADLGEVLREERAQRRRERGDLDGRHA